MSKPRFSGPRNPNFAISTSAENPIWRKFKVAAKMLPEIGISHNNSSYYYVIWLVICLNLGLRGQGIRISQFQLRKSHMTEIQDGGKNCPSIGIFHIMSFYDLLRSIDHWSFWCPDIWSTDNWSTGQLVDRTFRRQGIWLNC